MNRQVSRRRIIGLALVAPLAVSACSRDSGRNWFGRPPADTLEPRDGYVRTDFDNRPLIQEISAMRVEQTPGGVIVHATGTAATSGYWNVDLVQLPPTESTADTLRLEFRTVPPVTPVAGGQAVRQVDAAYYVSNERLRGIRTITVIGATNSRSSRR